MPDSSSTGFALLASDVAGGFASTSLIVLGRRSPTGLLRREARVDGLRDRLPLLSQASDHLARPLQARQLYATLAGWLADVARRRAAP